MAIVEDLFELAAVGPGATRSRGRPERRVSRSESGGRAVVEHHAGANSASRLATIGFTSAFSPLGCRR